MIPKRKDLGIWRGTTIDFEVFAQKKVYVYDPDTNTNQGDLNRTYEENLEFYGYQYEFIDFSTEYNEAALVMYRPYNGNSTPELIRFDDTDGFITLGTRSVRIVLPSTTTEDIDFDEATFKLLLIKKEVLSQQDQNAGVTPKDIIDSLLYGDVVVRGLRND